MVKGKEKGGKWGKIEEKLRKGWKKLRKRVVEEKGKGWEKLRKGKVEVKEKDG